MFSHISKRFLHHSQILLNEEVLAVKAKLGKGKKLPPNKQNLVILNAAQSRLVRKIPKYFQENKSIVQKKKSKFINTTEFEEQRSKLIKINSKLTNEEAIRRLNHIKPSRFEVSSKRYDQLSKEISSTFTLVQLKKYISSEYPNILNYKALPKIKIIPKILNNCWNLQISENVNPKEDLIIQREFNLTQTELYLLLIQRTFDKWIRANVKIIVLPEEFRVIVRSNKSHLQYIELALEKILKNIVSYPINLNSIDNHLKLNNKNLPINEIQKLSGVFFQNTENSNEFDMFSLGKKKFSDAKRLIVWSLENNSFINDLNLINLNDLSNVDNFKYYQSDTLPWLYQNSDLSRLQTPKSEDFSPIPIHLNSDKIFDNLNKLTTRSLLFDSNSTQTVTAVTFGQVLNELDEKGKPIKSILNTEIPFIKDKLNSLPLFQYEEQQENLDNEFELDQLQEPHSYFAQIKYMPSPFLASNESELNSTDDSNIDNFLNYPPLEFWFEVDENEKVKIDTLQAVLIELEINSTVLLPSHLTDLKFIKSNSINLIDPDTSNSNSDDWLNDQPGIKSHLSHAKLDFSGSKSVRVPDFVDINIPGIEKPVRYQYVSLSYRRHLNYKFNDKLLQYAVIEGGSLGGRTSELIMVGSEDKNQPKQEFNEFVNDAVKFVEEFESFATNNKDLSNEELMNENEIEDL